MDRDDDVADPPGLMVRVGKGNRAGEVSPTASAAQVLGHWLVIHGAAPAGPFVPITKGGRPAGERMTARAAYTVLEKHGKRAGGANLSPDDFRRTFVGDLLDMGVDPSTNTCYDRRGEGPKREAACTLHFSYARRRR